MKVRIKAKPILSKRLKEIGWTQKRLSDETGITQATISRFDKTSRHEIDHIFTIAYVLGIPVEKLFETRIVKIHEEE